MPYKYRPSLGGHAPGRLRSAFLDWMEDPDGDNEDRYPLRWLIGQLWNCTDVMPVRCVR